MRDKRKDINIKIEDIILNCRAVAVIISKNKILFQKRKDDEFWALPGGKIEVGATTKDTVKRELKEELNIANFEVSDVVTVSEYFFKFGNDKYHQYIFGHKVIVNCDEWIFNNDEFEGVEKNSNLVFKWLDIDKLDNAPIKPDFIKKQLDQITIQDLQFISYEEK